MLRMICRSGWSFLVVALLLLLSTSAVCAQSTAFTYQGRLTDGATAANGNYDLQFVLFDSLANGAQVGSTQTVSNVLVSAGIFGVSLDFGAGAFPGANRFLEIRARLTGAPSFTTLSPRQEISSTPYAIRSLSASTADTVTVSGIPGGSGNYIQNTTTPQVSNFNINGNGTTAGTLTGGVVNAVAQYNLGGQRILTTFNSNLFIGNNTGLANLTTGGDGSTFVGTNAGAFNTVGGSNAFFGVQAGHANTEGNRNSMFGFLAGDDNTIGEDNSFFGNFAGVSNTLGIRNTFVGSNAGWLNTTGSRNTVLGSHANIYFNSSLHLNNATAIGANARVDQSNSLVLGSIAGINDATASVNVGIGTTAPKHRLSVIGGPFWTSDLWLGSLELENLSAIAWRSNGTQSFGIGQHNGGLHFFRTISAPGTTGSLANYDLSISNNGNVGIGTTTPTAALDVIGAGVFRPEGLASPRATSLGSPNGETGMSIHGPANRADVRFDGGILKLVAGLNSVPPSATSGIAITTAGDVGIGNTAPTAKLDVNGNVRITLAPGGSLNVCLTGLTGNGLLAQCGSSLRYKTSVRPFIGGLGLIGRLRPINFIWKDSGMADFGLGAEDVAKIEPLLVTHNANGEIEGVKYDHLNVVLINAIKEQQQQIETLQAENATLNTRLRSVERRIRKRTRVPLR